VLKGLGYLAEKGIIEPVYRKGYYVRKKQAYKPYRICLILDKMNVLRDNMYNAFFERLKGVAEIDVFFHHHNFKVFERLINENLNQSTHFAITTFFREDPAPILNQIPPGKRIILDYKQKGLEGDYTCIAQDFKADIDESMIKVLPRLKKYERLVLIAPKEAYHGQAVIEGFKKFCKEYKFPSHIYNTVSREHFKRKDAYITFSRYDLDDVDIIKLARKQNWELGKDIGLLSYNDSAVKEILENGITVITTDFEKMGVEAANAIIDKKPVYMRDVAKVVLRSSL